MTTIRFVLTRVAVSAVLALTGAVAGGATTAGAATRAVHCTGHVVHVRTSETGPADQWIWGRLCHAGTHPSGTVQLLVPGGTYGHTYWDLPYGDGSYSYARNAAAAGYTTFDIDRVGIGHSSHPAGATLDFPAQAVALHDVIGALRAGLVGGHAFAHVMWVGHSVGSELAWDEIPRFDDVDAVILTGALHAVNPVTGAEGVAALHRATQDPRFAGSGLDADYFTTKPGTREKLYYGPATTDPRVVAADEATKETMTTGELKGSAATAPHRIAAPVLLLDGGDDALFCAGVIAYDCGDPASVRAYESSFYPQAQVSVVIVPDAGHSVALSTAAPRATAAMIAWSRSVLAP